MVIHRHGPWTRVTFLVNVSPFLFLSAVQYKGYKAGWHHSTQEAANTQYGDPNHQVMIVITELFSSYVHGDVRLLCHGCQRSGFSVLVVLEYHIFQFRSATFNWFAIRMISKPRCIAAIPRRLLIWFRQIGRVNGARVTPPICRRCLMTSIASGSVLGRNGCVEGSIVCSGTNSCRCYKTVCDTTPTYQQHERNLKFRQQRNVQITRKKKLYLHL